MLNYVQNKYLYFYQQNTLNNFSGICKLNPIQQLNNFGVYTYYLFK